MPNDFKNTSLEIIPANEGRVVPPRAPPPGGEGGANAGAVRFRVDQAHLRQGLKKRHQQKESPPARVSNPRPFDQAVSKPHTPPGDREAQTLEPCASASTKHTCVRGFVSQDVSIKWF